MKKGIAVKLSAGLDMTMCRDCNKHKIGTKIFEYFEPSMGKPGGLITYKDGICYINEQVLMSLIRMANPYQKDRKIQVVSAEEFMNLRRKGE